MAYLGKKGYSIYKSDITLEDQHFIRDTLKASPIVPKGIQIKTVSFPIYRESHQKLYMPRYFGMEHFGAPEESRIANPTAIDLTFQGDLREYQDNIISAYMNNIIQGNDGGLLEIPCGRGKTVMALKILSLLKVKTLIIVHKGFLLDQWVERIQQFLPNARVGRIQGQIIDIEDKDIVIGMLQSLSMKEYPESLFDEFGLLIVDEVHHIAAEVFVRSLFTVVTKYTLGLSATMNRKDGLSNVFKMFLGPVIYKEKAEKNESVMVDIRTFHTADPEFNNVIYDYKGNTAYAPMMSKLCTFSFRSEFIIQLVKETLEKNPNQHIMILGHYKALLTYLYKGIEFRGLGSVGYYVGGMKKDALKESEGKKIIIATYSMAAEALDIKTLTTLIMATPKTDVEQSIGRILRAKHSQPLVIDVVDVHTVFQRQAAKRVTYYKKQGYQIVKDGEVIKSKKKGGAKQFGGKCVLKL
jgi:superfamily II DNA or RNA helicase